MNHNVQIELKWLTVMKQRVLLRILFGFLGFSLLWTDSSLFFSETHSAYARPNKRLKRSRSQASQRKVSKRKVSKRKVSKRRSRKTRRTSLQASQKQKSNQKKNNQHKQQTEREAQHQAKTQEEESLSQLYGSLDISTSHVASFSPWVGLLKSHPRFIQAERLESAKGRSGEGPQHPCLYQGELKDDTCIAFNWGSAGFLKNPLAMQSTELYKTREYKNPNQGRNYGVPEMVFAIQQAVDEVHAAHTDTKRLVIGDLSRIHGGFFPPHLSHQSGRDADIGYYTKGSYQPEYLQRIKPHQLDVPRTWTFLHSFLRDDKVQYVFMDYYLQKPLYKYLKDEIKLPPHLLSKYLSYPRRTGGIIRHLKGHADHIHVRFYAPQSLEAGKAYLRKHGMKVVKPAPVYYRIRRGDTLIKIARRFRVKWIKIMKWNRLTRRRARRLRAGTRLIVGYRTPPLP